VWSVDGPPAVLGGLDQLEGHRQAGGPGARALGDLGAQPHGREGRLDRVGRLEVDPVLGREVEERQQAVEVVADLVGGLGPLRSDSASKRFAAATACSRSSASRISASIFLAVGWADFGSASSTLATLCTQSRCSRVSACPSSPAQPRRQLVRTSTRKVRRAPEQVTDPQLQVIPHLNATTTMMTTSRSEREHPTPGLCNSLWQTRSVASIRPRQPRISTWKSHRCPAPPGHATNAWETNVGAVTAPPERRHLAGRRRSWPGATPRARLNALAKANSLWQPTWWRRCRCARPARAGPPRSCAIG
jgi:hypothetical protein